ALLTTNLKCPSLPRVEKDSPAPWLPGRKTRTRDRGPAARRRGGPTTVPGARPLPWAPPLNVRVGHVAPARCGKWTEVGRRLSSRICAVGRSPESIVQEPMVSCPLSAQLISSTYAAF